MDKYSTQLAAPARPAEHTGPAIEMIDLCKDFGSFRAVDHLSLTVQQGEIFGLLGPNGSGKTTTINMISGLSVPSKGEVRVMGYDVRHQAREVRRLLGAIPQETALYEELTAWDNMDFHADLFGVVRHKKKERILRLLELVQLLDRKASRVSTFSGGMKRRLAIARALLHDPLLIYLEEAQALCERLAIIDHGKLITVDTPDHLKQIFGGTILELETTHLFENVERIKELPGVKEVQREGRRMKVTTAGVDHIVPQIVNIVSQDAELRDLAVREPTLDEIFLQLTGTALRD